MKNLIRRLCRVGDSSQYTLLRSESRALSSRSRRFESLFRTMKLRSSGAVGVPVYVGEELKKFVISAKFLNHPAFLRLLDKSAQEYGYEQQGVLRIPCNVIVFERILQALRTGSYSSDLLNYLSQEDSRN